ncbi:GTP pyrophosphokinase family protein [Zhouia sp. PK063]|uniref:GTP pyrophosphokinase family protein n=1 Tax=Zhouia sp. PK063 TaxID=3373602 RepID=UPI00379C52E0
MAPQKMQTPNELKEKIIKFYANYEKELYKIKSILEIELRQLCLAYTLENSLPPETLMVTSRVKTLESYLNKLEQKGFPQFYDPTEIVVDLIGARITSWFLDDCNGIMANINNFSNFETVKESIKDYISYPKHSGYRGLHLLMKVPYASISRGADRKALILPKKMICEIQIRTKLQDAWGEMTHEFHYKSKSLGLKDENLENFLSDISARLLQEDKTLMKFRDAYQSLIDNQDKDSTNNFLEL